MSADLAALAATGLGVGQISDALDELGLAPNAGGGYAAAGGLAGTVFGRAFTLRQVHAEPAGPAVTRQGEAAQSLAAPGDILVIDAGGEAGIATWGEGHALRALGSRVAGVIVHGGLRDAEALDARGLPVLHRGATPLRSKGRLHTAAIGEPVTIEGVRIAPGDLVAMSRDGIVAVSPADEARVLAKAAEILAFEAKRDAELARKAQV